MKKKTGLKVLLGTLVTSGAVVGIMSATNAKACSNEEETTNTNLLVSSKDLEEEMKWEHDYTGNEITWEKEGKFVYSILTNVGTSVIGGLSDNPLAVFQGLMNIATTLGDNFLSTAPSIQDVLNKLEIMDQKLDKIMDTMNVNFAQIKDEIYAAQAGINKVELNQYQTRINGYNEKYFLGFKSFDAIIGNEMQDEYKSLVNSDGVEVPVWLYTNKNNEWTISDYSSIDEDTMTKVNVSLTSFTNARASLKKNKGIIGDGFMGALEKDIDEALKSVSLPQGASYELVKAGVISSITEGLLKDIVENDKMVANYYNVLALQLCRQISSLDAGNIISDYYQRFTCTYNFGSEFKPAMQNILAKYLYLLDTNVAKSAVFLNYAGYSTKELEKEYKAARKVINEASKELDKLDDNYSFITKSVIEGNVYNIKYEAWFTKKGNHPDFHSKRVIERKNNDAKTENTKLSSIVTAADQKKIIFRMKLEQELGLTDAKNYVEYLAKTVLTKETKAYLEANYKETNPYILASMSERKMNGTDTDVRVECIERGNPKGNWFDIGHTYNYKRYHNSGKWDGYVMEGDVLDIYGNVKTNAKFNAVAKYEEHHWYWRQDEIESFLSNKNGVEFIVLETI